jgi:hypothetical protein
MRQNLPTQQPNKQVDEFLKQMATIPCGRLIFALDATMSRQLTWDSACTLQADMFAEAGKLGRLETQLVYYRGIGDCKHSDWTTNPRDLGNKMSRVVCLSGETQIGRILAHICKEHQLKPVGAAIFVGDAMEEEAHTLYDQAAGLGVPLFLFQEGADPEVEQVFRELVRLTKGAYSKFTPGAARELGELLRAVAAFTVGGRTALANLRTDSARKLLTQLK